ncbi:hypothetical protein J6590_072997 [Homalodisca vitripennis]|nr:hypothetical protein J6590_072997 [Homalodisca vitripennis]
MLVSTRRRGTGAGWRVGGIVGGSSRVSGPCFLAFKQRAIIDWNEAGIATGSQQPTNFFNHTCKHRSSSPPSSLAFAPLRPHSAQHLYATKDSVFPLTFIIPDQFLVEHEPYIGHNSRMSSAEPDSRESRIDWCQNVE